MIKLLTTTYRKYILLNFIPDNLLTIILHKNIVGLEYYFYLPDYLVWSLLGEYTICCFHTLI